MIACGPLWGHGLVALRLNLGTTQAREPNRDLVITLSRLLRLRNACFLGTQSPRTPAEGRPHHDRFEFDGLRNSTNLYLDHHGEAE